MNADSGARARAACPRRCLADLADGVSYAKTPGLPTSRSGAVYGGAAAATLGPYTVDKLMYALMDALYEP
jgi:hypothetical protein